MRFAVITAAWNCEPWIKQCLSSIAQQNHTDYDVCVWNDASVDRTGDIARAYCDEMGDRWHYRENEAQRFAVYTQVHAIRLLDRGNPDDVIVFVDGDDHLAHNEVFSHLESCYQDGTQVHYGSYTSEPFSPTCNPAMRYPPEVVANNDYRKYAATGGGILFNHLRTFTYRMWWGMNEDDFRNAKGDWMISTTDTAMMIPAMEMANRHVKCCSEILYVYNSENPQSDWRIRPRQVDADHDHVLWELPKKPPLV